MAAVAGGRGAGSEIHAQGEHGHGDIRIVGGVQGVLQGVGPLVDPPVDKGPVKSILPVFVRG